MLKYLLFFFFAFWANEIVLAENSDSNKGKKEYLTENTKKNTEVNYKPLNEKKWKKYNQKRDYLEKPKKEIEEETLSKKPNIDFKGFDFIANVLKIFVYLIVVLGFAFLIFKLIEAQYKKDAIVKNEKAFFIENLEEHIHSVNLFKLLEEYTKNKDFTMMIRIQYLIIIKELSNKKLITWHIQKTNGNYLQELVGKSIFEPFKNVTQLFERIWFGEVEINGAIYNKIAPEFLQTLEKIKQL